MTSHPEADYKTKSGRVGRVGSDFNHQRPNRASRPSIGETPSNPSNPSSLNSVIESENLLNFCNSKGIRLFVEYGHLLYDAPTGAVDDRLREAFVAHKTDLVALLTAETPALDDEPALSGPRRTPWNTLVWSASDAPPIELFGPPTNPGGPR